MKKSLQIYVKLTNAPVKITTGTSTFWSPNGLFPYLVTGDGKKFAGFRDIISCLIQQNYIIPRTDRDFDDSYIAVLQQNLLPYFMYTQWCNTSIDHSRSLYATRIPFPLNFIAPKQYVRKTEKMLNNLYGFSLEDSIEKQDFAEMAVKAKQVLNELEERLKETLWASGKDPSLLDVHVYPFVALIYNNPLPNNTLQSHVQQCPNLIKYVKRITKKYFENEEYMTEKKNLTKNENEKKTYNGQEEEDDPKGKQKRYIVSGLVATISMISYALFKGILHVSFLINLPFYHINSI